MILRLHGSSTRNVNQYSYKIEPYSIQLINPGSLFSFDDISDSGETLVAIMQHLEDKYSDIEFKSATLFYKETSVYKPHFWINEANDWIDFFWERDFK